MGGRFGVLLNWIEGLFEGEVRVGSWWLQEATACRQMVEDRAEVAAVSLRTENGGGELFPNAKAVLK
ncbi:hypothetical protein M0R45_009210 [Rubus argutus]|uniref:Uncharacterized protein n=1 Tax=Rubus argutus TaxID=59490 RepID=A0AAW1Y7A9_RUBAR